MLSGFLAVIIYGGVDKGWSEIWKINSEEHRLDIFEFNPDIRERHTVWSGEGSKNFFEKSFYRKQKIIRRNEILNPHKF